VNQILHFPPEVFIESYAKVGCQPGYGDWYDEQQNRACAFTAYLWSRGENPKMLSALEWDNIAALLEIPVEFVKGFTEGFDHYPQQAEQFYADGQEHVILSGDADGPERRAGFENGREVYKALLDHGHRIEEI
jgi:hypothetical protein